MSRLNHERQKILEPKRIESTRNELEAMGFQIHFANGKRVEFQHLEETVVFFPYSGWFTGKSVKDGRGFKNLLKQLDNFQLKPK